MDPFLFKDLSSDQQKKLPSESDILKYEELGWYVSPNMIPLGIINEAIKGTEKFYNGERDFSFGENQNIANDVADDQQALRNNEFVSLQIKEIQNLGFHPLITGTAALLARTQEIRLFADSLINKLPQKETHKGIVGWHSDKAYWPTCTSDKMLTAWIPLQDCTLDMGPLIHINKSHKWKDNLNLKSFFSFNNQKLKEFEDYLKESGSDYEKIPMTVKKGQVCFHNCHTIHSSVPNTSTRSRLALAMHFQDKSNTYQKAYDKDNNLIKIAYDTLCEKNINGDPNYADKNIFPLLMSHI